jgi:CHAT domain-containing protein
MKNNLFLIFFVFFSIHFLNAQSIPKHPNLTDSQGRRQGLWVLYINENWEIVEKQEEANYYRVIDYQDDIPKGVVKNFYLNGQIQREATLIRDRPEELLEGIAIWYNENGNITEKRQYSNNQLIKEWYYNLDGSIANEHFELLTQQAKKAKKERNYDLAFQTYQAAIDQAEKQFGKQHTQYATANNNLALMLNELGLFEKAEGYFIAAMQVLENKNLTQTKSYATYLNNLAIAYQNQRKFKKAIEYHHKAKELRKSIFGEKHESYINSLKNLGVLYYSLGEYSKSEEFLMSSMNLYAEALGKESVEYSSACQNLASVYFQYGRYAEAEELFLIAKNIQEKKLGIEHPEYLTTISNLSTVYLQQGVYESSEKLMLEAKNLREKIYGKNHPSYASSCHNLASLYLMTGKTEKVESLFLEAKQIREKIFGKKSGDYALSCNNLANFYEFKKDYEKAELLLLESKQIVEEVFGKYHPEYATSCQNLAVIYNRLGRIENAERLMLEAKILKEMVLGKNHPDYAFTCNNLAVMYNDHQLLKEAKPLYEEAIQIQQNLIQNLFPVLSEKERDTFLNSIQTFFENYTAFLLEYSFQNPSVSSELYNLMLMQKGILFQSSRKMKENILKSSDKQLIEKYTTWLEMADKLSKAYQMTAEERQNSSDFDIATLSQKVNDLEKELSKKSNYFSEHKKQVTWQDIKSNLQKGEVLVELLRSWRRNPQNPSKLDTVYAAIILSPDTQNYPELLILENGSKLEKEFMTTYNVLVKRENQRGVKVRYEKQQPLDSLYQYLWKPFENSLKNYQKVYFAADGIYHQININSIFNPLTKKYLGDELDIHWISSGRDLLKMKQNNKTLNLKNVHLFGYPQYLISDNSTDNQVNNSLKVDKSQRFFDEQGAISILEGTKKEIEAIEQVFRKKNIKVEKYLALLANEEKLKSLQSPDILHIATHGFFQADKPKEQGVQQSQRLELNNQNPLMRSGILLAGAENTLKNKKLKSVEDGVFTAQEALNLNLEGTSLVVLSACETGLGDIRNGEGVYGLQRSILQAGAKNLLISLWKVDDEATHLMMSYLYDYLLSRNSIKDSYKLAQRKLRENPKFQDPYFWAAFVLLGE